MATEAALDESLPLAALRLWQLWQEDSRAT